MQENRFEKQVQQQLEELQFQPTEPVWQNVAASIRRRKRRRIAAYISMIALLGLTLWGAGELTPGRNRSQREPVAGDKPDRTPVTTIKRNMSETTIDSATASGIDPERSPVLEQRTATFTDVVAARATSATQAGRATTASSAPAKSFAAMRRSNVMPGEKNPVETVSSRFGSTAAQATDNNNIVPGTVTTHSQLRQREAERLNADTAHTVPGFPTHTVPPKAQKRKISWAVEFSGGAGRREDRILPGGAATRNQAALYPGSAVMAPPAAFAVVRTFPSASNIGAAFGLGLTARVPLSSGINLLAGLRYQYQSEKINVGLRNDTTVQFINAASARVTPNALYKGPAYFEHTNRYHFVQLPLALEFQLNRGLKTPIYWEAGVAPGYLVASNALVYDTAFDGIYYKDKSMLHKFHAVGHTALSIQFGNKGPVKWSIGPEFRTSFTPLGEDKYDTRQRLIYGGVRARVFFR